MRPTSLQLEFCLHALREGGAGLENITIDLTRDDIDDEFILDLVEQLAAESLIRPEVVHDTVLLLDPRLQPSADQIASMLVNRLVCDRLR